MKTALAASTVMLALAGSSFGQLVPSGVTEASGLNTVMRNAARTYQAYYHQSNFTSVTTPTTLTGLQFRLFANPNQNGVGAASSWPATNQSFANYTIMLAQPSAAINAAGEIPSASASFASNMVNAVTVYNAALTITAGSFLNDGTATTPASWGMTINFSTPYTYNPGDGLMLYISHTGYTGGAPQPFFAVGNFAANVADAVSSTAGANATNPGGFASPMVVQFIPTPGAMAMLGLGGLVAARRRRA